MNKKLSAFLFILSLTTSFLSAIPMQRGVSVLSSQQPKTPTATTPQYSTINSQTTPAKTSPLHTPTATVQGELNQINQNQSKQWTPSESQTPKGM